MRSQPRRRNWRGGVLCALLSLGAAVTAHAAETVSYSYDAQGRLSTVTYPDNSTQTYLYENAAFPNAMTGLIDESGTRFSTWSYDAQGRAVGTYEAGGAGNHTLVYNADGSVLVTDALGAQRTFTFGRYGDRNLVTGISGSQCPTCTEPKATTYSLRGWVSSRTDYNNNVTAYTYDDNRGLELSRTEASGTPAARTITTSWHAQYRLPMLVSTYAGGSATGTPLETIAYTYDASGNQLTKTITDPAAGTSRTWSYTYNNFGQVLTADGPRTDVSDITTYTYYTCNTGGGCGQVQSITNALGQTTTYNTYNAAGQPLTITDPNGVVTTLAYDARQRLTSRTVGSETTTFAYFPTGLLQKVTLPNGSFLSYTYDAAHRLTQIQDADGNKVVYTLDAAGNHTAENLYDPGGTLKRTHSKVFNSLSQLYQDINAANTAAVTTQYGYDNNGNQTTINAPLTRNTSNQYDALNRLTQVTDPAGGIAKYQYDANDNLVSVIDPRNLPTTYSFNGLGDLISQASPDTGTTLNTYDSQGRVSQKQQTQGSLTHTTSYAYTNGDLTQVTTPSGQVIAYSYTNGKVTGIQLNGTTVLNQIQTDPFGPIKQWTWGNGTLSQRSYDQDGYLTANTSAGTSTYTFNADGSIASRSDDSSVNLNLPKGLTTLSVVSNSNRLSSTTGILTRTDTFDAMGNLTSDGTRTFTFNGAGKMTSATNAGVTTNYVYNALGQRIKKANSSQTTLFNFDEQGHLIGEYSGTNALIAETIWLGDIPVASIRTDQGGTGTGVFYIHTDHLNSPTKITRPTNNEVIWRWDHDAYGNGEPNQDPDGNGAILTMNLRFPGQYFDAETGNYYNYFRYYDPQVGRYVESDPIGLNAKQFSTYAYVKGNPVRRVDILGLDSEMCTRPSYPIPIPYARHCFIRFNKDNNDTMSFDPKGTHSDSGAANKFWPQSCTQTKGDQDDDCVKREMKKCEMFDYDFAGFNCCHCAEKAIRACGLTVPNDAWPNWPINPGPKPGESDNKPPTPKP